MPFVPQDEPAVRKAKGKFKRAGEMPFVPQDEPAVQGRKASGHPDRKSAGRDLSYVSGEANRATRA